MKLFIWGTGFVARELIERGLNSVDIEGFIDSNPNSTCPVGTKKYLPEEAKGLDYDVVLVASGYASEIRKQAIELGYDIEKFFFIFNNYMFKDINSSYELVEGILPSQITTMIKNRYHVIRAIDIDEVDKGILPEDPNRKSGLYDEDYIRIRTFECVVDEIRKNKIEGEVAELGVFKGEFSRYINAAFKERKCYLFDTFEGFKTSEAEKEKEEGNCGEAFIDRFKDTSLERVKKILLYPEQVLFYKGYFPESLNGLEEKFAFVSIDVDFEDSIYAGLAYFYPRLVKGGYIFVHDYNSLKLKGVKKAVERYEAEVGTICKVPIPDINGTVIITK